MDKKRLSDLKSSVHSFLGRADKKSAKGLKPDFVGRVLDRLFGFSGKCEECKKHLADLAVQIEKLASSDAKLARADFKNMQKEMDGAVSHLQKRHKLIVKGLNLATYTAFGLSLGVAFGLTVFDNLAIGIAFGLSIGVAIGNSKDGKAKKDGRVI